MLSNEPVGIFGDGKNSRLCHVQDVVNANILAASSGYLNDELQFIILQGVIIPLNKLFKLMRKVVIKNDIHYDINPIYQDEEKVTLSTHTPVLIRPLIPLALTPKQR